jgi:hypothetical protein
MFETEGHKCDCSFWRGWSGTKSTITGAIADLLYQPKMMISVEQSAGYLAGEILNTPIKPPQCRFVHHISHIT